MRAGWEVKKLGEVAKTIYGYTESASYNDIGPKFLRITDIQNDGVNWGTVPFCKISDVDIEKYKLIDGDIVFARTGATTGKSFLVSKPPLSVFASYLIKVHITDKELIPEYLFLFFQTKKYWDTINAGVSGSAQGGFNATKLSELNIPLPPLPEQKRIVAILDKAFAAIARAKENAERNLANARELFERYLQGVFASPGEGWEETKFGDVGDVFDGPHATPKTIDKGPIFLGIGSLVNGHIALSETRHVSNEDYKLWTRRVKPKPNDIVFSYETRLGQAAIIPESLECCLGRRMGLIRCNQKKIYPMFLLYQYLSPTYKMYLRDKTVKGATVDRISIREFPSFIILLPSLKEQYNIVAKLNTLSTETQKLESLYHQKLADLDELKKSILQKAFAGEL